MNDKLTTDSPWSKLRKRVQKININSLELNQQKGRTIKHDQNRLCCAERTTFKSVLKLVYHYWFLFNFKISLV